MSETLVSIKGLDKAAVLKTLWDYADGLPQEDFTGHMFMVVMKGQLYDNKGLPIEKAQAYIDGYKSNSGDLYFDYLEGCALKIDISGDTLDPRLYDRNNGQGRCAKFIGYLRRDLGLEE